MAVRYRNTVIPITIAAGQTSGKVTQDTETGFIARAIIAGQNPVNTGLVRASITDSAGNRLAENQPLEIFRSRNVDYEKDGVPMRVEGGKRITFEINATQPFDEEYNTDLVLVYTNEEN